MSEEQNPFWLVGRAIPLGATSEEGAQKTGETKMSEEQRFWPEPQWRIEAEQAAERERKQARAELRDRFAEAALTGLLAASDAYEYNRDKIAAEAWRQADAMLKARGDE